MRFTFGSVAVESTTCSLGGFDNSWQHTLSLGLIFLPSVFQIKSIESDGLAKGVWRVSPRRRRRRNNIGKLQARELYILLCEKSLWVHRKANTIKRGWGSKMNWLLKCSKLATKTLSHFPHISTLSSSTYTNSVQPTLPHQTHRVWT